MSSSRAIVVALASAMVLSSCQDESDRPDGADDENGNGGTAAAFAPTGPFRLSQDSGRHTEDPAGASNEVKIVFNPDSAANVQACDEIVLIQTIQMFVDGQPIRPDAYSTLASFGMAETWTIDDVPGTPDTDENGTYLDTPNPPDTHASTPGSKVPGYTSPSGINVQPSESDAELIDPPMAEGGDRGFQDADHPNGYETITWKFETCAYCERGADAGTFYECLTWEHTRTAADAAAGRKGVSRFKGQRPQPSDGFREAYRKFKQRFP